MGVILLCSLFAYVLRSRSQVSSCTFDLGIFDSSVRVVLLSFGFVIPSIHPPRVIIIKPTVWLQILFAGGSLWDVKGGFHSFMLGSQFP